MQRDEDAGRGAEEVPETIRQRMIDLLCAGEMTAIEISQELHIAEKEVYAHLPHVARSVGRLGKRLVIRAFRCLKCGYVFKDRQRFTRPGRCPRCKGTHLERPLYVVE
ncbi:transcriptional regulator [Desulfatiglans anilini]|uniref:transcriptional regulator n=1 Tax=Desulfatiglans anilini TaxID=90728 RepID=UPI0003FB4A7B|nr:transcriptional regulator [Desulfatiglans anilini]